MMKNKTYIVEYTSEDCIGNQCLTMEVDAPNLETAYEIMDNHYPDLAVDTIYLAGAPADWFEV
jgi:hypothetical protein